MDGKKSIPRLIAFDMDGTLLDGRVIYSLGRRFGFTPGIDDISKSSKVPYIRSRRIAKLLKGMPVSELTEVVEAIPLTEGAVEVVKQLKGEGYIVGIISDSYTQATETVARRLDMDFHIANRLEVKSGVFTGLLKMPMGWEEIGCICKQSVCKHYHLIRVTEKFGVDISDTVAVGDSRSDLCMIDGAGVGIWFNPMEGNISRSGSYTVRGRDLRLILNYLKEPL